MRFPVPLPMGLKAFMAALCILSITSQGGETDNTRVVAERPSIGHRPREITVLLADMSSSVKRDENSEVISSITAPIVLGSGTSLTPELARTQAPLYCLSHH